MNWLWEILNSLALRNGNEDGCLLKFLFNNFLRKNHHTTKVIDIKPDNFLL